MSLPPGKLVTEGEAPATPALTPATTTAPDTAIRTATRVAHHRRCSIPDPRSQRARASAPSPAHEYSVLFCNAPPASVGHASEYDDCGVRRLRSMWPRYEGLCRRAGAGPSSLERRKR